VLGNSGACRGKLAFCSGNCGFITHETASALDLLTLLLLPGSILKSSGKGEQTLALPPDHLGVHVCHSNLAL
jgi:hypothetical protein